jgi:hypothetical protein
MTKRMTDEQLREWLASAAGATPGPWRVEPVDIGATYQITAMQGPIKVSPAQCPGLSEASFIARCDPQAIGGLIKELQAARLENAITPAELYEHSARIRNAALDEAAKVANGSAALDCRPEANAMAKTIIERILALKTPEREDE